MSALSIKKNAKKEIFQSLSKAQEGLCAICRRLESKKTNQANGKLRNLCIDHRHSDGKIRGLLCSSCNTAIGMFEDDVRRLKRAIEYLEKDYSASPVIHTPVKVGSHEFRQAVSQRMKGNKHTAGKTLSEETKKKISLANKGKKRTSEQRENISRAARARAARQKNSGGDVSSASFSGEIQK